VHVIRLQVPLFDPAHHVEAESPRPLDRIEGVLRGDRKVATYKLALLRALTDIATTQARRVRWRGDGRVAVPIDAVAELWISYYWPLFESPTFLPQMQGEAKDQQHKLGFARELEGLMGHFRHSGRLPGFLEAWHSGRLTERGGDEAGGKLLGATLGKLRTAIRTGPVHYAGRSTSGPLFDYDVAARAILVDEALWQSNELWNLLPAAHSVNLEKSDRLPERGLLRERRPLIRDYWHLLHGAHPRRFTTERGRLTGTDDLSSAPDLEAGFDSLRGDRDHRAAAGLRALGAQLSWGRCTRAVSRSLHAARHFGGSRPRHLEPACMTLHEMRLATALRRCAEAARRVA
jgi:hypothetical protein